MSTSSIAGYSLVVGLDFVGKLQDRMSSRLTWDHVHLISADPFAAVEWYRTVLGGEVTQTQHELRGAPQIDVRVGGRTVVIRGVRPGEQPADPRPIEHFGSYSS